ncbi:uroporphyrinogen-III synthase [Solibacillus silvestris]|uniref:uroporphyrinogen-III synthase n=1 Tax=Solibacillus silvestris TaxID=76853 RepID=UPI003F81CB89
MPNRLAGKTIILTGSTVVASVKQSIEQHGGTVRHLPLIETVEKISDEDASFIDKLPLYDWLIFTSQNAVISFLAKCIRHHVNYAELPHKIAAVGEKTAELLGNAQLKVHFMPTVYSADVFVQEFRKESQERVLFLRGSMAKATIRDGTGADEWTIYETQDCLKYIEQLEQCLISSAEPIVIFASPSAVDVYAEYIVPDLDWCFAKFASIGHVTTAALAKYGVKPIVQPKIYTMQAVVEQLILEEQTK